MLSFIRWNSCLALRYFWLCILVILMFPIVLFGLFLGLLREGLMYAGDGIDLLFAWIDHKTERHPNVFFKIFFYKVHKIYVGRFYGSSSTSQLDELTKLVKENNIKCFISKRFYFDSITEKYYVLVSFKNEEQFNFVKLLMPKTFTT